MNKKEKRRIVIAITGASGSIYADLLLKKLLSIKDQWEMMGIVMSENAVDVWRHELGNDDYNKYADISYHHRDFNAPFASGSAGFNAMAIVPCSMGALGRIASGVSNDLISRAADAMLKEKGVLICAVRETPYSLIHIKNMETVALAGGIICPASPSFYHKPATIVECAQSVVDRIIKLMGMGIKSYEWGIDR